MKVLAEIEAEKENKEDIRDGNQTTKEGTNDTLQAIDIESRTIDVAFCSENPVERDINGEIYYEILLCGSENADLRRLNNNGAVLFNHNHDELIGAVVSARMDSDRVGRATLKISSTANDEWK